MAEVWVVHEQDDTIGGEGGSQRVLARAVEIADTALTQMRGLMFRSELPEDFALVMEVGGERLLPFTSGPKRHSVHMLFVRVPLDVLWLDGEEVTKTARMRPWRSVKLGKANRIIELPAGAADGVEAGDTVRLVDPEEVDAEPAAGDPEDGDAESVADSEDGDAKSAADSEDGDAKSAADSEAVDS
jgi:uncharacterized membrane protein (UPF0127 family)